MQGYDYVQMQYSNSVTLPVSPYDIGVGSWFYLDPGGGVFQSNTTGTLQTVVLGNDGSVSATGNITGDYFFGNGSQLTGIIASGGAAIVNGNSNVTVNANSNVTVGIAGVSNVVVVATTGEYVAGVVSATGNVTGNYFIGNGSQLTGLPATYSNANVATFLANFGSNVISTTGNITANYFIGNGSQLTGVTAATSTRIENGTSWANIATANGNLVINTSGNSWNFDTTGNLTLPNGAVLKDNSADAVAFGQGAGAGTQGNNAVAIGANAGYSGQSQIAVAVGFGAGKNTQGEGAVAIGVESGLTSQGTQAIAIGYNAGYNTQSGYAVGIGGGAGETTQGVYGVAIAGQAAQTNQGAFSVAIGYRAGRNQQGANAIAIGSLAGETNQATNSIILNATNANLDQTTANTFTVAPVRNDVANIGNVMFYNPTSSEITWGNTISVAGNITGNYFLGNGSQLTGLPATYGNANVTSLLAAFGSNSISTTGNVTASYFAGNGSLLSSITGANVTGTVANATYAVSAGSATTAGTVTTNAQPNITSVGTLTSVAVTGNATAGNLLTGGIVSATGNITGNYFLGNGSQLTGITTSAGGSNTQIQFNNAGVFAGNAALTFNNANGNTGIGNLIIGSVGFGNAGGAQQINTIANNNGTLASATTFGNGQIVIGSGYFGNLALNNLNGQAPKGGKFVIWDSATVSDGGNAGIRYATTGAVSQIVLGGNLNNNNTLFRAQASVLTIGGGANNYILSQSVGQGISGVAGTGGTLFIGQPNTTVALGNVTVGGGVGLFGQEITYAGSTMGNAAAVLAQLQNNGNTTTGMGLAIELKGTSNVAATNAIGILMRSNSLQFGIQGSNTYRSATNYYFLRNDDDVAQNQLGSLRAYHTFQGGLTSSGTVNIDKSAGQVQAVSATGNITIGSYTGFVTTANDGTNNDSQTDTVTLIIEQGATPYTVTMPTGNAAIKYAGNVTTVTSTANTTTMIAITAYRTAANATGYLTTISPGFV